MNLYNKYILPKILNSSLQKEFIRVERPGVVEGAEGVVLEIGFGSGLNLPYYKNVKKLYALDPSLELYKLAEERIIKAGFPVEQLPNSAEKIPLPDGSVDWVVSTWNLCSIPDAEVALREVKRVLKPGGIFSFVEHGKHPKIYMAKLQKVLTPFSKCFAGGCHLDKEIDTIITSAGFKIKNLERFYQRSQPLIFMYKGQATNKEIRHEKIEPIQETIF